MKDIVAMHCRKPMPNLVDAQQEVGSSEDAAQKILLKAVSSEYVNSLHFNCWVQENPSSRTPPIERSCTLAENNDHIRRKGICTASRKTWQIEDTKFTAEIPTSSV